MEAVNISELMFLDDIITVAEFKKHSQYNFIKHLN